MPRNWSKAVPGGNGPVPQKEEQSGPDQPTLADVFRFFEESFDRKLKIMDELADELRATKQRLAGMEQVARQPRLAMEADVPSDTKSRKRMEDAVAVQAKHGDSCFANQIDPDPICLTSFVGDNSSGPPALPSTRDDALVDNGAVAPKQCLSPVEIRTPTATGGLLPAGTASTATRNTFPRPLFPWIL